MTSLFLGAHRDGREWRHGHFFWRSVNKSQTLHIKCPGMFDVDAWFHFALPASVPREAHDDLVQGMKEARAEWLKHAPSVLLSHPSYALRDMLGQSRNDFFPMNRMDDRQVARALYGAVKDGNLLFVPELGEMRQCVQAIREQREKDSGPAPAQAQRPNEAGMQTSLYGNSPRVPQSLGNAQPFTYQPNMPDGDVEQLAKSTVNERYAARMLGYDMNTFGGMIHALKDQYRLRGDDNVTFHDSGDVYFNGEWLDNIHTYSP
jgi:hypothetical protein